MKARKWTVVLLTALGLAALGTGVLLAAPWAQQASPPEETASGSTPSEGFLGVAVRTLNEQLIAKLDLPEGTTGVLVVRVLPDGPAAGAGLLDKDVVTAVDGAPVADVTALKQAVAGGEQGDSLSLTVLRGGEEQTIPVVLGGLPASPYPGAEAPKIVDGQLRVMKGDALVTVRVAAGTVVAVEGDTLTIEKPTPDAERASFTITDQAKVVSKGQVVEPSTLVGEQVVVYEEEGVVKKVQAGLFRPGYGWGHAPWLFKPGPLQEHLKETFGKEVPSGALEQMERMLEEVQRRFQELRERTGPLEKTGASSAG